ncbi:hypothetical protein HHI36_020075 [Cryptolaemus montrouzieri]|uniref:Odorant receptor n=1 Tax=Cryptolaemus montrouzieri TaxID=559131 RepID=A0ABD2N951_9CUCU
MALKSLKEKLGIGDDPKPLAALYFIQEKLLIHPGKGKTYDFKHILKTQIIYLFVLGLTFNGGIIGHFLMSSSDIMFTERFESAFNIIISSLQLGYTLIHMILGNEFMRLLKRIDSAKFGRPKKLLVEYRLFNIFCVAFTFVIGVFVVLYSSFHYFHNDFCNGRTILKDKRFVCGLTAPAWYPFEIEDGIQTNILLFWSFLYLFLVEPSSSFFIFGDIELTKLVQIKMMDLRYQIDQIEDVQSKEFKKKFKFFVAYYTEILGCIRDLNNTMGYCMMAATSLATLSLALMEFNILIVGIFFNIDINKKKIFL